MPAAAPVPVVQTLALGSVPETLARTAPWAHFLAILGFVMVGLMMVAAVGAGMIGVATGRPETAVLSIVYPLTALMYFFPSLYLLQFAKRIRHFVRRGHQLQDLESALDAQRRFWKVAGIIGVATVALSLIVFVVALL